jgi:hypothetical protein
VTPSLLSALRFLRISLLFCLLFIKKMIEHAELNVEEGSDKLSAGTASLKLSPGAESPPVSLLAAFHGGE